MDSVGIGEAPDADKFGDVGSDTLGHIAEEMNGLNMPVWVLSDYQTFESLKELSQ